ncbi:MAG: transpeptidase family protein [Dysgonamonadaceae bacterium]|jgi:cell division protein FtsI (penicillin-binding protein 3)|nr:transpeptidase family protein [Dysgonamonadaceae bacterium]
MAKDLNNNKKIQRNYFLIALFFGAIVVTIVVRAVMVSFVEGNFWRELGEKTIRTGIPIPAVRGNIYSDNHELMATSEYRYRLYLDFWAEGVKKDTLMKYIKPLSKELNKMFPDKSAATYEAHIMRGWRQRSPRNREYLLNIGDVNYLQLKVIRQMPFFRQGQNKSGLYARSFVRRVKPYGTLASRTIGDIYGEFDKGGKNGLELAFDSLLRGHPGTGTRQRIQGRNIHVTDKKPVHGCDIISTININMQDITEKALLEKLRELDAESGTAVLMEVKTGEIKAIANLGRIREGVWGETKNYAVADLNEPGSTFKVASMMVALDDGLVQPDDPVDVGNGVFDYAGSILRDHNANRGGYGMITAAKSIWFSSNIGVAKIILKSYGNNPGRYVDGLYRLGFNQDFQLDIPGYGIARIRHPKTSPDTWYKTTLPWMSFGYETQIPPIYTLTFFNAIANNGTMVKPVFVREIREDGHVKEKKTEVILKKHICSTQTLRHIREMLDSVVNHPQGTGKPARSELVRISGKTGTAQISQGAAGYKSGGLSHHVSFCGYFPSGDPLYSCIVVIRKPRNGSASGGYMSGRVFKRIAEDVFVQNIAANHRLTAYNDTIMPKMPLVKSGLSEHSKYAMKKLDVKYDDDNLKGKWMSARTENDCVLLNDRNVSDNIVPNITGMGAKDAVYALESAGLHVSLTGVGTVVSQSVAAGSKVEKGRIVAVRLK